MTQHTAGPWQANGVKDAKDAKFRLACAVWRGETPICTTSFSVGRYNEVDAETRDANARLIAAAPDLLMALQNLRKQLREHVRMDVKKHYSLMVADVAADKAIAKARGEA